MLLFLCINYGLIILGGNMKTKLVLFVVIGIVLIISLISVILLLIFNPFKKKIVIENIDSFNYSYTTGWAMYSYVIYNIRKEDDKYIVRIKPDQISDDEAFETDVDIDFVKRLESILNKYNISSWDGFSKSDSNVLDGDSFSLSLVVGEDVISSHGYMMWPNNYRSVKNELDKLFMDFYNSRNTIE